METRDKAKELVDKFLKHTSHPLEDSSYNWYHAIECALICVDEILTNGSLKYRPFYNTPITTEHYTYWEQVKQEIKKWKP